MKMRSNYVSNSSSSSFLVTYKDIGDFAGFASFDGYEQLMNDLGNASENDALGHIKAVISRALHEHINTVVARIFPDRFDKSSFYGEELLMLENAYDLEECKGLLDELNNYFNEMWDYANEIVPAVADDDMPNLFDNMGSAYHLLQEKSDKIWPDVEFVAAKIYYHLKSQGWKVAAVEYGDDTDEGSYMEHEFMPFISNAPRMNFIITNLNCH